MAVSYDKLWVILNEREMMKTDLIRAAKISTNKPLGIHILETGDANAVHWFLEDKSDTTV